MPDSRFTLTGLRHLDLFETQDFWPAVFMHPDRICFHIVCRL
jgi:hypothetical protein